MQLVTTHIDLDSEVKIKMTQGIEYVITVHLYPLRKYILDIIVLCDQI